MKITTSLTNTQQRLNPGRGELWLRGSRGIRAVSVTEQIELSPLEEAAGTTVKGGTDLGVTLRSLVWTPSKAPEAGQRLYPGGTNPLLTWSLC